MSFPQSWPGRAKRTRRRFSSTNGSSALHDVSLRGATNGAGAERDDGTAPRNSVKSAAATRACVGAIAGQVAVLGEGKCERMAVDRIETVAFLDRHSDVQKPQTLAQCCATHSRGRRKALLPRKSIFAPSQWAPSSTDIQSLVPRRWPLRHRRRRGESV